MPEAKISIAGDFWTEAGKSQDKLISQLQDAEFLGIAIAAPETVALGSHSTLPIIGIRGVSSKEDNFTAAFSDLALLVVTHVESNQTYVANAFGWKASAKKEASRPSFNVSVYRQFMVDVRERVPDLPWRPGTLRITILLCGQKSNTVVTQLLPPPPLDDPEVLEALQAEAVLPPPRQVSPGVGFALPITGSPALPEAAGIVLGISRVVVIRPESKCLLNGSFILPIAKSDIVRRGVYRTPGQSFLDLPAPVDIGDPEASGVVPMTFVVTGHSTMGEYVYSLNIPVYSVILPGDPKPVVQGYFSVDLFALPDPPRMTQNYSVWAFSAAATGGPVKVALITPDMLP